MTMFCHPSLKALADEIGIAFLETSAKDATNVEEAFIKMSIEIKNRLEAELHHHI